MSHVIFSYLQLLQFHVFDYDDHNTADIMHHDNLGFCEVSLAEIMAKSGDPLQLTLSKGGGSSKLLISGEEKSFSKVSYNGVNATIYILATNKLQNI